jgi:pSer/pThr/pTyr-binding forkhead associated (FHA) protein
MQRLGTLVAGLKIIVIDDPRVSRNHAQLRDTGRFVLFDLNSTGGPQNGQRTSQTVLYPGDVISLQVLL